MELTALPMVGDGVIIADRLLQDVVHRDDGGSVLVGRVSD
jgi:hypothetical protein